MDDAAMRKTTCWRFSPIRQPMAAGRKSPAHRYARGLGVSRRRPRAQGQARGALSVSRLFDAGKAQSAPAKPRSRSTRAGARNLSWRRRHHARERRTARDRRQRRAGRMGGRHACASTRHRTLDHLAERDRRRRSPMRSAAPSPPRTRRRRSVEAEPWIKALGAYIDEHVEAFAAVSGNFSGRGDRRPRRRKPRRLSAHRAAVARARPARARSPHPRRSSSRQYRADRRQAGAVRRHRIQRNHRLGRRALRSRLSVDGPARTRAAASGQYRAQPLPRRNAPGEDLDALAALPFFLSMRAAIRAKVTVARHGARAKRPGATRSPRLRAPISISRCGRSHPPAPKFIAVGGLSGTGKTRLARALAPHIAPMPGAVIVRSDVERKTLFGVDETEKLPAAAYAPDVTARVYTAIADKARRIVAAGHSAIVDAVFARPQERDALAAAAKSRQSSAAGAVSHRGSGRPESLASAGARRTPPTPTPQWCRPRKATSWARSTWPKIDASGTLLETLGRVSAALSADPRPR